MVYFVISGHFVWETNLEAVNLTIPWGPSPATIGTEEHVLFLGGNHVLYIAKKDFVDPHHHGVVCEF